MEVLLPVGAQLFQGFDVLLRQREHGLGLEGDGVTHVTTLPAGQTCVEFLDSFADDTYHQFVGIGTPFVNLQSRVSAAQALDGDAYCGIVLVGLHLLIVERGGDVDTASASDDEFSPVLGVEVQQDVALQLTLGQVIGTIHARLLVGGYQRVDGTVLQVFRLHDGHDRGHAQSVVGSQCRALGLHPLAVDPRLYGIGLEVVCRLRRLLWHHVHVGLQDDAFTVLHAWRGRFAEHDVAGGILKGLHACLFSKLQQELLYFFEMSAGTRHLC